MVLIIRSGTNEPEATEGVLTISYASPDTHAEGLLRSAPDSLRYEHSTDDFAAEDLSELPGILRAWIPDRVRLLDVGCGTGTLTLWANAGKCNTVMALEPDEVRAESARARGLNVTCAVLDESFMANRAPFEVVVLTDVLEHVASPADLLRMSGSALSEKGLIVASVPNVAHWTVRVRLLFGRFDYANIGIMDATHLRWFTEKSLKALFDAQGMKIVSFTATAGLWMSEYRRFPFTLLPRRLRESLIRGLTRVFPRLFGCQFVVKAEAN